jgi:large subunit ribosomal protein L15
MKVHDLRPPAGSNRARKRVGRGIGGKGGKTAGRGTKGQGARDTIPMGFEGGQLPLMQRIPKLRGFTNPFRVEYTPVNVGALGAVAGDTADIAALVAAGLAHKGDLVKVLGGGGELPRALRVEAHAFSKSAEAAITAAGGSISIVPLPFGNNRPPAKGNALTNR